MAEKFLSNMGVHCDVCNGTIHIVERKKLLFFKRLEIGEHHPVPKEDPCGSSGDPVKREELVPCT